MALTRKALKAMGISDEQIDSIIEMHTETVEGLKADVSKYKTDAEKLPTIQTELDELKKNGGEEWKIKHDNLQRDFEQFKIGIETEKTKAAKETAVKAYYESKNITGKNLDIAMRGSRSEIEALELENGKIKDATALDALIAGDFSALVIATGSVGAPTPTPPGGTNSDVDLGSLSMADYIAARSKK